MIYKMINSFMEIAPKNNGLISKEMILHAGVSIRGYH